MEDDLVSHSADMINQRDEGRVRKRVVFDRTNKGLTKLRAMGGGKSGLRPHTTLIVKRRL